MSEAETPWASLSSRVIHVAMAREGCSYARLIETLAEAGVDGAERPLIARVSRGSVKFTLLLQIIQATEACPPPLWADALALQGTWEARAQAVMAAELALQPWVTPSELVRRLAMIGVVISERTLTMHLSAGTFSLSLFLQCVTVLRSSSLDIYLEFRALVAAAMQGLASPVD
ncbi:TPA: DUF6471 domain-containing protein [Burkholderia cepacia]|uniref:DUF6471 domain-containing protein n=1 Tax=Burkholderia cepacia TaxID=292 RepID=UPI001CF2494A|nr:DUF6471 domain-containing protein [Burkholderia cepacia]MCA8355903.1 DUF6471 domain-containing protein [Burkholderia cepacia]HDR9757508.1 hypothetical protein [Burkholderia cepacia ATCC 25416]HDV6369754.1 hypothetical protein [Burkholderia cepacia]